MIGRTVVTHITVLAALWFAFLPAVAAPVQAELPNQILGNAEYQPGDPALPAVLILHGFLSTHSFNTVQVLLEGLAEAGYSVLAPTLSLNISDRRQGLDCEAIHTHTLAGDVQEIAFWVRWLEKQGHKHIGLVGHSTGSLLLAEYLNGDRSGSVKVAVLTAPAFFAGRSHMPQDEANELAQARQLLARDDHELGHFSLSFCHGNYVGTAASYLSYIHWGLDELAATITAINVPTTVVTAGLDTRFGPELEELLAVSAVKIRQLPEAGHFFDSPHEFEFIDMVLECLEVNNDASSPPSHKDTE